MSIYSYWVEDGECDLLIGSTVQVHVHKQFCFSVAQQTLILISVAQCLEGLRLICAWQAETLKYFLRSIHVRSVSLQCICTFNLFTTGTYYLRHSSKQGLITCNSVFVSHSLYTLVFSICWKRSTFTSQRNINMLMILIMMDLLVIMK